MKIELDLTSETSPLQLDGKFGEVWVYYRAWCEKWDLWINPDGPATDPEWLGPRKHTPTAGNVCSLYDEVDLGFALRQITREVEDWHNRQPTKFTISRDLAESVTAELRALAIEEGENGFADHAASLLGLVERLTQNPVPRT